MKERQDRKERSERRVSIRDAELLLLEQSILEVCHSVEASRDLAEGIVLWLKAFARVLITCNYLAANDNDLTEPLSRRTLPECILNDSSNMTLSLTHLNYMALKPESFF